jgi:hypothetical protein
VDGATVRTLVVNNGLLSASAGRIEGARSRPYFLLILLCLVTVVALTAASSPAPTAAPQKLHSGTEGAKAALVRIELRAATEIAHIDHSTGEVRIKRGRSTVPLGTATGVLISADGVVATTWESLDIGAKEEDELAVYAANELFAEEIGVPVVGNGGDPSERGHTTDSYWAPHLHHCYDKVEHCVLFHVPQYHVRTYTSEPAGVMATRLNSPTARSDVALLQISGGGGAPTATVAARDTPPGGDTLLFGFTKRPGPELGPVEVPVKFDAAAGQINSPELAQQLVDGVSGGPVVDQSTGQVLGLAGPRRLDGAATLVSADAIRAAMDEAGVEASPSKFDVVFRRGVDHLAAGNPGGSAESTLEEALTYYDSALAMSHLGRARDIGNEQPSDEPATASGQEEAGEFNWAAFFLIIIGALLLAGIIAAVVVRRRGTSAAAGVGARPPDAGLRRAAPAAASTLSAKRSFDERTGPASLARGDRKQGDHGGSGTSADSDQTKPNEHQRPVSREPGAPVGLAPAVSEANSQVNAGLGSKVEETHTAGPPTHPANDGQGRGFCSQCGRAVAQGARFCTGCGHPVG